LLVELHLLISVRPERSISYEAITNRTCEVCSFCCSSLIDDPTRAAASLICSAPAAPPPHIRELSLHCLRRRSDRICRVTAFPGRSSVSARMTTLV
jgi:hypothetical protein